jgi:hemerythrin superfamily protein
MENRDHADVIAVLTRDHREVEGMFAELAKPGAADPKLRRELVDQVIIELMVHAVAEEQYLYPAVRRHVIDGDSLADREIREHAQAEHLMKALERMQTPDVEFENLLGQLMAVVREHVNEEEALLLPRLAAECTTAQLLDLGTKVTDAKKAATTGKQPAPGLGLVDRVRDLMAHRGTEH